MERGQRRRALLVAVAALALVAAVAGALLGASGGGGSTDPFAYTPARAADYQQRATAGYAHVLYAKSPGGVIATAQRVAALRPLVEAAARASGSDPNRLEAIVFLESAGRPDALASSTPGAAAGLTQILGETARDFLGLRVDQAASARLTAQIAQATARGQSGRATQLAAKRRSVDQRFDPAAALAAAGRYLATARRTFAGREDLATESYHMGIGNLENVLRAYGSGAAVPYVQLFFDSSPLRHPASWRLLDALGDDSDTYLWRVLAAEGIMSLYRQQPALLDQLAVLQGQKGSAEEVLHPRGVTTVFADPAALSAAYASRALVALPADPARLGFAIDPAMGQLAPRIGSSPPLYRGLTPPALALLEYLSNGVRALLPKAPAGATAPLLTITSSVRDTSYQQLLARSDPEATHAYSLHTTGYAFDVSRRYASPAQARALQFWLDRLQALNLIAWVREPTVIHITAAADASRLQTPAHPSSG